MRAEELKELLEVEPFVPLRIHMTDGKIFEIYHPDNVLVLRSRVDIGVVADPPSKVLDRVEHCSILHVVRIEELHSGKPAQPGAPPNGGPATPPDNSGAAEGPPSVS